MSVGRDFLIRTIFSKNFIKSVFVTETKDANTTEPRTGAGGFAGRGQEQSRGGQGATIHQVAHTACGMAGVRHAELLIITSPVSNFYLSDFHLK